MNTLKAIFSRRSVRKYTKQSISKEDVQTLLKAAQAGPTAVNSRDWTFIAVDDKQTLLKMSQCNGYAARMLPDAAFAILVCGDLKRAYKNAPDYWVIDCSIACQNIILAATELGIGSVWLGTYPQKEKTEKLAKLFNLPEHIVPHSIICLGYSDETPADKTLYEEDIVHFNHW